MTRLPTVGADSGAWGTVLNQYLQVGHNATGTNSGAMPIFNVKDDAYGCKVDGVTDDTTGLASALAAANAAGGGVVSGFNGGTCISGNQTLYSNVILDLQGGTIKLKNGANTDLFSAQTSSINLSAAYNTGVLGTLHNFGIRNGTLDGNKANQSSGPSYPLRFYGYAFSLENAYIRNGYSGGILTDFNADALIPTNGFESKWSNVGIYDSSGMGIEVGGPTDQQWTNVIAGNHSSHCIHICPNAGGLQATNVHGWTPGSGKVAWLIETAVRCANCEAESSNTAQVALLADNCSWVGGDIFSGAGIAGVGLIIGQANGGTAYAGQIQANTGIAPVNYLVATTFSGISAANGNIQFLGDSGGLIFSTCINTNAPTYTGTPGGTSTVLIQAEGATADGSSGKSPTHRFRSNAFFGFNIGNPTVDIFNADTYEKYLQIPNGTQVAGYSGNYTGLTWQIDSTTGDISTSGNLSVGQSATTPDPGASGTIATANTGLSRVTPAASRAGCILQSGTVSGQEVWVINNSASFTISWATQATSHISGEAGGTFVLAAKGAQKFVWDSVASLWYKAA